MKKLMLSLIMLMCAGYVVAQDLNLDKVLENHFKATGQEKIAKVKSLKLSGKAAMMGMEIPFLSISKRPGMNRSEFEIQGMKIIQAFDGTNGWAIIPFSSPDPQDMPADQLKSMKVNDGIDGALYNWKSKGNTLELVGKEDMDGVAVYNLKMVTADKDVYNFFIDATSFLLLKTKAKVSIDGNPIESETAYSNYKELNGMKFPYTSEITGGQQGIMTITVDTIDVNVDVDNSQFTKPVKGQ